jgi:hypothetical protein
MTRSISPQPRTDLPPETCNFREYIKEKGDVGSVALDTVDIKLGEHAFLSRQARDEYFADASRLVRILERYYNDTKSLPTPLRGKAEEIQRAYKSVFATLLYIGRGRKIEHFLSHDSLSDTHNGFDTKPDNFPENGDETFWHDFQRAQWMFFVPNLEKFRLRTWSANHILPFRRVEKLGEGDSGVVFKIRAHPAYNHLHTHTKKSDEPLDGAKVADDDRQNVFVLKTFRQDRNYEWKKEGDALQNLREGLNETDGAIQFFGAYQHDDTFNILLEYANGGNLKEYLEQRRPPTTTMEIQDFWESMFRLIRVLAKLDNMKFYAESSDVYRGYVAFYSRLLDFLT